MDKITTNLDQHGRMLILSNIRERFKIEPGDKVTLEITNDALIIKNIDHIVNEIHSIFIKNKTNRENSIVDDFISSKRKDSEIEVKRDNEQ
jgi:bifunctional DNA-binding transcriptional regulator/antitoxin component of YhaV-PrlF toxin-antitoxin module